MMLWSKFFIKLELNIAWAFAWFYLTVTLCFQHNIMQELYNYVLSSSEQKQKRLTQ